MKVLIFGANGSLGKAICKKMLESGNSVNSISHSELEKIDDVLANIGNPKFDSIIWAGGLNLNDSIGTLDLGSFDAVFDANLKFVLRTVSKLVERNLINPGASLVLLSSVWQNIARKNKVSYTISKSALSGLVRSLALELGEAKIRCNSVSPGVVDNEMSRANLTQEQISTVVNQTPLGELVTSSQVANVVAWLSSTESAGITGQNIVIDGGWTIAKYV